MEIKFDVFFTAKASKAKTGKKIKRKQNVKSCYSTDFAIF